MKVLMSLMPTHMKTLLGGALGTAAFLFAGFNLIFMDLQANMLNTSLERHIVRHSIPGREGYVLQDMGGKSTEISISGKWIYENEPDDKLNEIFNKFLNFFSGLLGGSSGFGWNWIRIETMKMLARSNVPLMLASDLFIGPVLIERVSFSYAGGQPNVYDYQMKLIEWNPKLSIVSSLAMIPLGMVASGLGGKRGY